MWFNALVIAGLASPLHRLLDRSLIALRIVGQRTGRIYEIPVQYAHEHDTDLVVYPARHWRKHWWQNFRKPADVQLLHDGQWHPATARLVTAKDQTYMAALAAYDLRWPNTRVTPSAPFVVISPTMAT